MASRPTIRPVAFNSNRILSTNKYIGDTRNGREKVRLLHPPVRSVANQWTHASGVESVVASCSSVTETRFAAKRRVVVSRLRKRTALTMNDCSDAYMWKERLCHRERYSKLPATSSSIVHTSSVFDFLATARGSPTSALRLTNSCY